MFVYLGEYQLSLNFSNIQFNLLSRCRCSENPVIPIFRLSWSTLSPLLSPENKHWCQGAHNAAHCYVTVDFYLNSICPSAVGKVTCCRYFFIVFSLTHLWNVCAFRNMCECTSVCQYCFPSCSWVMSLIEAPGGVCFCLHSFDEAS